MTNWSDEVRVRLEQVKVGLWIDGVWVADIRAALGEIERLARDVDADADEAEAYLLALTGSTTEAEEARLVNNLSIMLKTLRGRCRAALAPEVK